MTARPKSRRRSSLAIAVLLVFTLCAPGVLHSAIEPGERLTDSALETRARKLSAELRCLVCQNQSIDDSDAPLARDLRRLVRERLTAGSSDREVLDFVVARYGDFVLLRPPLNASTVLLWLFPLIALLLAIYAVRSSFARRDTAATADVSAPLTDAERKSLELLMAREPPSQVPSAGNRRPNEA